jgi:glycosyltransferase involved in cell wall biosynthesis
VEIHHYNTSLQGGAAIAAKRIFESIKSYKEFTLKFISLQESKEPGFVHYEVATSIGFVSKIKNKLFDLYSEKKYDDTFKNKPNGYELFSPSFLPYATRPVKDLPDIIHLHWLGGKYLDYGSFFESIPDTLPIVWTLHDMNPFTAGCHYTWGCDKFTQVCHHCPQLGNSNQEKLSHRSFLYKLKALNHKNLHIVADSQWLEHEAKRSRLFNSAKSFQTIHYGVDHQKYVPKEKSVCKEALGIPKDKFVICFGAFDVSVRRKGLSLLLEAIEMLLPSIDLVCLTFGSSKAPKTNLPIVNVDAVRSENILSIIYSAADVFVIPSIYEAFGQTAIEAMSCETPVIGFDTGGIRDIIDDDKTGYLIEPSNVKKLSQRIRDIHNDVDKRIRFGKNSRDKVLKYFDPATQAEKYFQLYYSVVNDL